MNSYVVLNDYDEIVVIADVGVVGGLCCIGRRKEIVILEDGINDYSNRPRWISKEKMKSVYNWQGFFSAKIGYCHPWVVLV